NRADRGSILVLDTRNPMPSGSTMKLGTPLAGRYALESEIGSGGMATVYLATDLKHGRTVAIKVLRPDLFAAVGVDRFQREIRAVAALNHPHILPLLYSGEPEAVLFSVIPHVKGESLRRRLDRERQLPIDDALRLTRQIASALEHAHTHGLIHRDIKPDNIPPHEGEAMVADFGIALATEGAPGERLTATGLMIGTPAYVS